MVCPEEVNFLTHVAGGGPQPFTGARFVGMSGSLLQDLPSPGSRVLGQ